MQLISVITPFRNARSYFHLFHRSITHQSYKNIQPILIDDCSSDSDDGHRFLESIKTAYPSTIFIRSPKNGGPGHARNLGLEASTGDLVAFHDIDDYWLPNKLEYQVSQLLASNKAGCCTAYIPFDGATGRISRPIIPPGTIHRRIISRQNPIGNLTAMVIGDYARQIRFQTSAIHEDYIYWCAFIKKFGPFSGHRKITALYRVSPNSFSSNKRRVFFFMLHLYIDRFGHTYDEAVKYAIAHSIRGATKNCLFQAKRLFDPSAIPHLACPPSQNTHKTA